MKYLITNRPDMNKPVGSDNGNYEFYIELVEKDDEYGITHYFRGFTSSSYLIEEEWDEINELAFATQIIVAEAMEEECRKEEMR